MCLVCLEECVLSNFRIEGAIYVQYIKSFNYVVQIFYILTNFFLLDTSKCRKVRLCVCVCERERERERIAL